MYNQMDALEGRYECRKEKMSKGVWSKNDMSMN